MSGMAADLIQGETETERVESWRAQELERAGYSRRDSAQLAQRFDVDLHFAVELVARGCSHELAMRILL
jgi:hypothetical protein